MNTLNPWETQLRSWKPRPPSASLERRLFQRPCPPPPGRATGILWQRLAPALGCLLLTVLVAANHSGRPVEQSASELARQYVLAASSNQTLISYQMPLTVARNVFAHFPRATFDWTNQSPFPSTTGSFSLLNTNSL